MSRTPGTTLCDLIAKMPARPQDRPAYQTKVKGRWTDISWIEYFEQIEALGCAFLKLGLKPGDRVALMAGTRWEWSVTDLATMSVHGVTVPIYQTSTPEDLELILNDSQARFLVLESRSMMKTFLKLRDRCPSVEKVFVLDRIREEDFEFQSWGETLRLGEKNRVDYKEHFHKLLNSTSLDDIASVVYTSGTTGKPKGVVITHTQVISEVAEAFSVVGVTPEDVSLSFLPYAHVLGRVEEWGHVYTGFTLAFAESIEKLRGNLTDVKPTILVAVPRIFEKIFAAIQTQIEANPLRKKMFHAAMSVGLKVSESKAKGEPLPMATSLAFEAARRLVLNKIKNAFGGKLRFAISGGAPLSSEIIRFFHACDILVLEGYGLTETTAAVTVNTPYDYEFGTVGKPIGDVEVKIAEDGEILIRSKKVMKEYYQDPESTEKVLQDGWFATGDIGELTAAGHLRITDRKKDLIKTAGGKYIAPQKLENILKTNSLISQVLIHGDQKKYVVALLTLDPANLKIFAEAQGLPENDTAALTQNPRILEEIRKGVAEANAQLSSYETIKRFAVLPHEFTIEAGELTPSLKIKRKFLDQKYRNQLEKLYG